MPSAAGVMLSDMQDKCSECGAVSIRGQLFHRRGCPDWSILTFDIPEVSGGSYARIPDGPKEWTSVEIRGGVANLGPWTTGTPHDVLLFMQMMGSRGGKATAAKRSAEQRSAAARKAAKARWAKP
jgi:hypothetical protein